MPNTVLTKVGCLLRVHITFLLICLHHTSLLRGMRTQTSIHTFKGLAFVNR
nr:MAG TPA: hypothetical protein [Caudoviricetes sp.]